MDGLSSEELPAQVDRIEARLKQFKRLGYDILKSRKFVIECAGDLVPEIVELGTGKGHTAVAIAKAGYSVTSVDNDPEMLEIAGMWIERSGVSEKVRLVNGDIENLELPDGSFSTVISIDLWHHLVDHNKALSEMRRVWNGKGKLIISDMDRTSLDIVGRVHRSEGRVHPEGANNIDNLGDVLRKRGAPFDRFSGEGQITYVIYEK